MKMKNLQKPKWWLLLSGIVISVLASGIYYQSLVEHSENDIRNVSVLYTAKTENVINMIFHKTDVLAAVVKLQDGIIDEAFFEQIAQTVYTENSGIRGIQYMPGAVVTMSYPVEGNEAVIGKNFFEIPEREKDVWLAINTKSIALSGPYHLLQGGLGVVARNPVFLQNADGKEYFWGFSAIILDLPKALDAVELNHLSADGYDYQLFCVNENGERIVIAGNPELDTAKAVCSEIQVPHHVWILALADNQAGANMTKAGVILLIGILLSVILWLQYSLMQQKEAAIAAKDRFFSDISHDMRTPLNAVIGFSTLGQKENLSADEKNVYLQKIESSGKLLLALINDTLTISKANMGKLQMHPVPVSTEVLLASIMEPIRLLAKQKQIMLHFDDADFRQRTILTDRLNVQKIFLNLLNNAVKYTPNGGNIWFTVRDTGKGKDKADVRIEVRDDGIGIAPEFIPHIYEPFVQERRKGYDGLGTGLGLSIVRQLVELMGGTIAVQSKLNQGTRFIVSLPFPEAEGTPTGPEGKPAEEVFSLQGKKILLCEDNPLNRELVCEVLGDMGLLVDTAENGEIGVEKFAASSCGEYQAVLMDIRMPVMDGYEAARRIRLLSRPDAGTVPIFAVTADAFSQDVQKGLQAGMNGYLTKPIDPQKIIEVLCKTLMQRSADTE